MLKFSSVFKSKLTKVGYTEVSKDDIRSWLNSNHRFAEMLQRVPPEQVNQYIDQNHNSNEMVGLYSDFMNQFKSLYKDTDVNVSYNDFVNAMKEVRTAQLAGQWFLIADLVENIQPSVDSYIVSQGNYDTRGMYLVQASDSIDALRKVASHRNYGPNYSIEEAGTTLRSKGLKEGRNSENYILKLRSRGFRTLQDAQAAIGGAEARFNVIAQTEYDRQSLQVFLQSLQPVLPALEMAINTVKNVKGPEVLSKLASSIKYAQSAMENLIHSTETMPPNSEGGKILNGSISNLNIIQGILQEASQDVSSGKQSDGQYLVALSQALSQSYSFVNNLRSHAYSLIEDLERRGLPK